MLTVLFLGDVVGEPGRNAVIARLTELKERHNVDFIIVNGENAAAGRGITGKITIDLLRAGVSVLTTGDHAWDQKDILTFIDTEPHIPASHKNAVPPGRICSSAVWTCVCVPITAETFPSRKRPIAIFSLVVSP